DEAAGVHQLLDALARRLLTLGVLLLGSHLLGLDNGLVVAVAEVLDLPRGGRHVRFGHGFHPNGTLAPTVGGPAQRSRAARVGYRETAELSRENRDGLDVVRVREEIDTAQ